MMTLIYSLVGSILGVLAGCIFLLLFAVMYWSLFEGIPRLQQRLEKKFGDDLAQIIIGVGTFLALCGICFGIGFALRFSQKTPTTHTAPPAAIEVVNPEK